jgi:hypothetical protein
MHKSSKGKRYKLFKKHMMNTLIPMIVPKNIHTILSGKQLCFFFDNISVELYQKRQKVLLTKNCKKEKTTPPPANEDGVTKEINAFTITSLPGGWMYQKGYPEIFSFQ